MKNSNDKNQKVEQDQAREDQFLERIYTDAVRFREEFDRLVINNSNFDVNVRLIIIHGVGSAGKTTALRMSRLLCRKQNISAAIVGAENIESKNESPLIYILEKWAEALAKDGITLNNFQSTLKQFKQRDIILSQAQKDPTITSLSEIGKGVPVLGWVIGPLSKPVLEWIAIKYSQRYVELFENPQKILTQKFLEDLEATTASGKRIILMLDTYNKIDNLNRVMCELTQQLPQRVMMVIAARKIPQWENYSPSFLTWSRRIEMEKMRSADLSEFVNKAYKEYTNGQELDFQQVEQIVEFAEGIPLFAETVVRLLSQQGKRAWQDTQLDVISELVKRLLEDVPEAQRKAFQSAAILRYFNVDSLKALLPNEDAERLFDELREWPFVRSSLQKKRIHESMRSLFLEHMRNRSPLEFQRLHRVAKDYYESLLQQETLLDEQECYQIKFEILYHTIGVNEQEGMELFQEIAEDLATSQLNEPLQNLLRDANSYDLKKFESILWKKYYDGRLKDKDRELEEALKIYQEVAETSQPATKLRAYALFDLGRLYRTRTANYNEKKALNCLQESLNTLPKPDGRIIFAHSELYKLYISLGQINEGIKELKQLLEYHKKQHNIRGIAATLGFFKHTYGIKGDWKNAYLTINKGHQLIQSIPTSDPLFNIVKHCFEELPWIYTWSGRYHTAELIIEEELHFFQSIKNISRPLSFKIDYALVLGLQGKYQEASLVFSQVIEKHKEVKKENQNQSEIAICLGYWGLILMRQGIVIEAESKLKESLSIKKKLHDQLGILEVRNWYGELFETKAQQLQNEEKNTALNLAKSHYEESLKLRNFRRCYFECAALAGLARVSYFKKDYLVTISCLAQAEQIADQYEYNDYLAWIKLIQGHLVWLSNSNLELLGINPDENKFNRALDYYQQSLIYALRYNHFLLDEILSGQSSRTIPLLKPIIVSCRESGEEGRQMLIDLCSWWQEKTNTIKASESETISPIPLGIPLQEAERIAREKEQGDGSIQKTVIEKIEEAISN